MMRSKDVTLDIDNLAEEALEPTWFYFYKVGGGCSCCGSHPIKVILQQHMCLLFWLKVTGDTDVWVLQSQCNEEKRWLSHRMG